MLRWLRRILVVIAVLIALAVLVPMAYIEGSCRPPPPRRPPRRRVTLARDRRAGLSPQADNTFFTFPEWYIVYSFEDFGRFLDHASESGFNYLGHILGFWRSFCTINRAVPATGRIPRRRQDDDLHHRRQLFRRIRHQGPLREHHRPRHRMDQGRASARRRTIMPARCCRTTPRSSTPSPGTNFRSARS